MIPDWWGCASSADEYDYRVDCLATRGGAAATAADASIESPGRNPNRQTLLRILNLDARCRSSHSVVAPLSQLHSMASARVATRLGGLLLLLLCSSSAAQTSCPAFDVGTNLFGFDSPDGPTVEDSPEACSCVCKVKGAQYTHFVFMHDSTDGHYQKCWCKTSNSDPRSDARFTSGVTCLDGCPPSSPPPSCGSFDVGTNLFGFDSPDGHTVEESPEACSCVCKVKGAHNTPTSRDTPPEPPRTPDNPLEPPVPP